MRAVIGMLGVMLVSTGWSMPMPVPKGVYHNCLSEIVVAGVTNIQIGCTTTVVLDTSQVSSFSVEALNLDMADVGGAPAAAYAERVFSAGVNHAGVISAAPTLKIFLASETHSVLVDNGIYQTSTASFDTLANTLHVYIVSKKPDESCYMHHASVQAGVLSLLDSRSSPCLRSMASGLPANGGLDVNLVGTTAKGQAFALWKNSVDWKMVDTTAYLSSVTYAGLNAQGKEDYLFGANSVTTIKATMSKVTEGEWKALELDDFLTSEFGGSTVAPVIKMSTDRFAVFQPGTVSSLSSAPELTTIGYVTGLSTHVPG